MANRWVMENIPVTTEWMDRTEAEKKYGFTLYQGGVVPGKSIRVIQIPGVDASLRWNSLRSNRADRIN